VKKFAKFEFGYHNLDTTIAAQAGTPAMGCVYGRRAGKRGSNIPFEIARAFAVFEKGVDILIEDVAVGLFHPPEDDA